MTFRRLCSLTASLGALLLCATPAWAGVANTFNVSVTPNAVKVDGVYNASYTEPDVGDTLAELLQDGYFVSYTVSVRNAGKNTANDVVFVGKAFATDGDEKATYVAASDSRCSSSTAQELVGSPAVSKWVVTVTCSFGQMKAKASIPPFVVTFVTPKKDVDGGPDDAAGSDKLSFNSVTYYAEGGNDVPTGLPNSTYVANAELVVLGTATSKNIRSTLLQNTDARAYKTGPIGSDILDQIKTSVSVPANVSSVHTIDIEEKATARNDRDCVNFSRCYVSTTSIPNYTTPTGEYMIFEINVGKAAFKNNFSASQTIVVELIDNVETRLNVCEPATGGGYTRLPCLVENDGTNPRLSDDATYLIVKVRKNSNGPLFIR